MFAPLGEIIRNGIAQTTPSGLFFAIGEQLNALSGLALCLIMAWSHMDNPRRNGTLFMSIGLVWFLLCGVLCGTLGIPSLWTVIPTAPLVLLVLRWLTELPWRQLLLIVATASYMVAIVYYLSLVIDVAVLGADSTNLRVGWPGLVNLLLLDVVVLVSLWHPLHDSIPVTFDSPSISKGFWQLIWLFPFVSSAIVVWCMPADNSTLLDSHMLEIAFTVAVVYSCFMVLVYFLIWYMIQQSDRLLAARRRQHYEALQTLQLQHMNERIREARQIKHNVRHHIHSLQALAAAEDMDGIRSYLDEMSKHRLLQTAPMQYCEHASLNAVLVYYCDWVRHLGADVDVKAAVPQYININNAELCSMVGNLLENATEAITQQTQGERRLKCASGIVPALRRPCSSRWTTRTATPIPASNRSTAISSRPNMVARGWAPPPYERRPNGTMARPPSSTATACSAPPSCCVSATNRICRCHAVSIGDTAWRTMRYDGQAASRAAFVG